MSTTVRCARQSWPPVDREPLWHIANPPGGVVTFVEIYDGNFSRQYGFWWSYVEQAIYRYLSSS